MDKSYPATCNTQLSYCSYAVPVVTSLVTTVAVHILVVGPLVCIVLWFSCVCVLKCGVYDYLHGLCFRKRPHSTEEQNQEEHAREYGHLPRVPVQEFHIIEESGDREPLIALVNDV